MKKKTKDKIFIYFCFYFLIMIGMYLGFAILIVPILHILGGLILLALLGITLITYVFLKQLKIKVNPTIR